MRLPKTYACVQAGARTLAWLMAIIAIVVLAWIGNCWPGSGEAIVAGLLGSAIAMLNDSWEIAAIIDQSATGFPRLTTGRKMVHDLFSLAICVGGIIMIWVSHVNFNMNLPSSDPRRQKQKDMLTGIWMILAVVLCRFIFALWGCADVTREVNRNEARRRARRERRHEWPQ